MMKPDNPKDLYNHIAAKYSGNRSKASNDYTELPAVMKMAGDVNGKKILDAGCGPGSHSKRFIEQGAEVTGFDVSEEMVKTCKKNCGGKGEFFVADLETVTFKPHTFDLVNASMVLMYIENIEPVFKSFASWVKKDGTVIFSIFHPVNYFIRTEKFDWSTDKKLWIHLNNYEVDVFNWYHPLEVYYDAIRAGGFELLKIVETTIPRDLKGWPEHKYRIPNAMVFKMRLPFHTPGV